MDGRDVYRLRKRNLLTQKELGEMIGCSQSVISRLENGKRKLRRDDVLVLAHAFPTMVILRNSSNATRQDKKGGSHERKEIKEVKERTRNDAG